VAIGLGVVVAALAVGTVASAQLAEVAKAVAEPITKQLEAFRRDDYDVAYTFASAEVQQVFDRQAFERMVKGAYPEIAHSTFAFVARTEAGPDGHVLAHVKIQGANGHSIEALYDMVREGDGWRINGVVTKPDPGLVFAPLPSRARAG
jgi:hypothetical protein